MKKATAIIITLILAFSVTACGDENARESNRTNSGGNASSGTNATDNQHPSSFEENQSNSNIYSNQPPTDLEENPVSDFEYGYDTDIGGIEIKKYSGTTIRVRIPEMIEGIQVKKIGNRCFQSSAVMYVYIPNSVTIIGSDAFASCNSLTSITLPDDVAEIDNRAFWGCTALTSITIPDSVLKIGNSAFSNCTELTNFIYDGNLKAGILMQMSGYLWRILEVRDGKALVISEDVLEHRAYHTEIINITWANCNLRMYLNNDFYNTLSSDTKMRISETQVVNNDNPDYGTPGGANTTDKLFLLSTEEVQTYFPDNRDAYDLSGNDSFVWWLRSPGRYSDDADYALGGGVGVASSAGGSHIGNVGNSYGVRPAMWVNLE
jgi:hypothetical protein